MTIINDLSHQLFSEILKSSREKQFSDFAGDPLSNGHGFTIVDHKTQKESFYLRESIGLLGFHHPISIKASLKSASDPRFFLSKEETLDLYSELATFLSHIIGDECHIAEASLDMPYAKGAGRFSQFLSAGDLKLLQEHRQININFVMPFSFSIRLSQGPANFKNTLTLSQYYMAQEVLRFLQNGPFYKAPYILKERAKNLRNIFEEKSIDSLVDNLSVKLASKYSPSLLEENNIYSDEGTLYLPLWYDDETVETVASAIEDLYVRS